MTTTEQPSWAESRAHLRTHAEKLIRDGAIVPSDIGGGALGVEALELLYRRASDPEFAVDALKLLHELKTHQVELDLLLEQILASEKEATDTLVYYRSLYQLAPVAYLVVARDGQVIDGNNSADSLLGLRAERSAEHTLRRYLTPPSRVDLSTLLNNLETRGAGATCQVRLSARPEQRLSIHARLAPSGDRVMLTLSQCGDSDTDTPSF